MSGAGSGSRPATIAAALDHAASSEVGLRFFTARGDAGATLSYAALREAARATGRRLAGFGFPRGTRIALIAETGPDFLASFYGCQYAGLVPCPLPLVTTIGGRDAYIARTADLLRAAAARLFVAPAALAGSAAAAAAAAAAGDGDVTSLSFDELASRMPEGPLAPLRADEIAYLQFSSGSTARPKGIVVTQAAVSANAAAILHDGIRHRDGDRGFCWLPLYHDMGLVGFSIAPLYGRIPIDYLAPAAFLRRPGLWVDLISRLGSTISYAPSFGYRLAVERTVIAHDTDLSALRVAGIGGDMIQPEVLERFAATFARAGFRRNAFRPSYGLAEATLAVSFADGFEVDAVDAARLGADGIALPAADEAPAKTIKHLVVCGKVIAGHQLRIAGPGGEALPERHVGRVLVHGPSVMPGYASGEADTRTVLGKDGFLDTGDLGYLAGGALVVTGRTKDVIHHRGRNIWPDDIESAAAQAAALRHGDVAAFAVPGEAGEERLVVLVQSGLAQPGLGQAGPDPPQTPSELCRRIAAAIAETAGIASEVVLVPRGSLPRTTSGKLSRMSARERYLGGAFEGAAGLSAPPP